MNKDHIRQKNLAIRKTLNQDIASSVIVSKILSLEEFCLAKNVLIFHPLKSEINLLPLLKISGKNFYLPKVSGDNLLICPYTGELEKGSFGIFEPKTEPILDLSNIEVAFIPCLAIDKNLNRIGYGKGYYDRLFLRKDFFAKKIAVINKELMTDEIDVDKFDIKVDSYVTD